MSHDLEVCECTRCEYWQEVHLYHVAAGNE